MEDWIEGYKEADARVNELKKQLILAEARRKEMKDWIEDTCVSNMEGVILALQIPGMQKMLVAELEECLEEAKKGWVEPKVHVTPGEIDF